VRVMPEFFWQGAGQAAAGRRLRRAMPGRRRPVMKGRGK